MPTALARVAPPTAAARRTPAPHHAQQVPRPAARRRALARGPRAPPAAPATWCCGAAPVAGGSHKGAGCSRPLSPHRSWCPAAAQSVVPVFTVLRARAVVVLFFGRPWPRRRASSPSSSAAGSNGARRRALPNRPQASVRPHCLLPAGVCNCKASSVLVLRPCPRPCPPSLSSVRVLRPCPPLRRPRQLSSGVIFWALRRSRFRYYKTPVSTSKSCDDVMM